MKVFDVVIPREALYSSTGAFSVFAEDAAQATRIAVRAANRGKAKRIADLGLEVIPGDAITLEDVSSVVTVRAAVAS